MHLLLLHRLRLYGAGRWGIAFSIKKKNALIFYPTGRERDEFHGPFLIRKRKCRQQ
jgi:hypothetical protein